MKILCVSDTHGQVSELERIIPIEDNIDFLLHAGDHITDVESIEKDNFNIVKVKGNRDRGCEGNLDELIYIEDKKILLTHGHRYRAKYGLSNLAYKAVELEADIVVFGHTHKSLQVQEDDILYLNPGSLTYPRDGQASYGIIEINEGEIKSEIKAL
ncbi:YfcE family phosphodiesterase [Selenihalanaerobacter shriftii]|uniref:Phosphoesterase n=1 Tax=Selenihalanaerobacter shriftii TaxID=142842 RepID=A0A1T4MMX5_9FIRM|nr:metallophosphoesterase [Selenihalanaerobacter shriftii]SJZ68419.1 hypothetical protein SAMN02745118_01537 [Selenihalanaerobacter shriftii]